MKKILMHNLSVACFFTGQTKRRGSKSGVLRDGPLFFYWRGLPFLGLADNFFLRVMCFKQFFSLHFVMKTIFLQPFLKNVTGFFIDLIWKKTLLVHAYT